jgi:hypothetical protein
MDNDLNHFFYKIKISENGKEIHTLVSPKSGLLELVLKLINLKDRYTIRIYDHEEKLRMDFSLFDRISANPSTVAPELY